jgi:predicted amidohydrolase
MRLCLAQTRPFKGDIERNIQNHLRLIDVAISMSGDMIVFPELSLTGYEPTLAKNLATDRHDPRFKVFQQRSTDNRIIIGAGVPTKSTHGIHIAMMLFQPDNEVESYSKKYLHADEEPFFVSGENFSIINANDVTIAPAICYELSVPPHAQNAAAHKADIYLASVAKFTKGIEKATHRMSEVARTYSMTALMVNFIGECDGGQCAGKSSVWDNKGLLVSQLNEKDEGLLILDTNTKTVTAHIV